MAQRDQLAQPLPLLAPQALPEASAPQARPEAQEPRLLCPAPQGLLGLQALIRLLLGQPDPQEMREATVLRGRLELRLQLQGLPGLRGQQALLRQ